MEHDNDLTTVVNRARIQLSSFYDGDPWVTENFKTKVLSLHADEALKKIPGHNHSVAQLVGHIIAWRNFAIEKLTGNNGYDIDDNSLVNWPEPLDWPAICRDFELCNQQLLNSIDNFLPERWNTTVPGRNYSFVYLLYGIIEHDYYHYGQIGTLLAGIKKLQGL